MAVRPAVRCAQQAHTAGGGGVRPVLPAGACVSVRALYVFTLHVGTCVSVYVEWEHLHVCLCVCAAYMYPLGVHMHVRVYLQADWFHFWLSFTQSP